MDERIWDISGVKMTGEIEVIGETPVLLPPRPLQISQKLNQDRTWSSAVKERQIIVFVTEGPIYGEESMCNSMVCPEDWGSRLF